MSLRRARLADAFVRHVAQIAGIEIGDRSAIGAIDTRIGRVDPNHFAAVELDFQAFDYAIGGARHADDIADAIAIDELHAHIHQAAVIL